MAKITAADIPNTGPTSFIEGVLSGLSPMASSLSGSLDRQYSKVDNYYDTQLARASEMLKAGYDPGLVNQYLGNSLAKSPEDVTHENAPLLSLLGVNPVKKPDYIDPILSAVKPATPTSPAYPGTNTGMASPTAPLHDQIEEALKLKMAYINSDPKLLQEARQHILTSHAQEKGLGKLDVNHFNFENGQNAWVDEGVKNLLRQRLSEHPFFAQPQQPTDQFSSLEGMLNQAIKPRGAFAPKMSQAEYIEAQNKISGMRKDAADIARINQDQKRLAVETQGKMLENQYLPALKLGDFANNLKDFYGGDQAATLAMQVLAKTFNPSISSADLAKIKVGDSAAVANSKINMAKLGPELQKLQAGINQAMASAYASNASGFKNMIDGLQLDANNPSKVQSTLQGIATKAVTDNATQYQQLAKNYYDDFVKQKNVANPVTGVTTSDPTEMRKIAEHYATLDMARQEGIKTDNLVGEDGRFLKLFNYGDMKSALLPKVINNQVNAMKGYLPTVPGAVSNPTQIPLSVLQVLGSNPNFNGLANALYQQQYPQQQQVTTPQPQAKQPVLDKQLMSFDKQYGQGLR